MSMKYQEENIKLTEILKYFNTSGMHTHTHTQRVQYQLQLCTQRRIEDRYLNLWFLNQIQI
jgi:hypothetical protein